MHPWTCIFYQLMHPNYENIKQPHSQNPREKRVKLKGKVKAKTSSKNKGNSLKKNNEEEKEV